MVKTKLFIRAFTLMELIVVTVIIGIIAAFAIPNYNKSVSLARQRRCVLNLETIHGANEIYKAKNGRYAGDPDINHTLEELKNFLKINILLEPGMSFGYMSNADNSLYWAWFVYGSGSNQFTIELANEPSGGAHQLWCSGGGCLICGKMNVVCS